MGVCIMMLRYYEFFKFVLTGNKGVFKRNIFLKSFHKNWNGKTWKFTLIYKKAYVRNRYLLKDIKMFAPITPYNIYELLD
jgi:hypothetical protein